MGSQPNRRVIIDADTHLVEPRDMFTSRLSSKYGDIVPQVRYNEKVGEDWWFVDDIPVQRATGAVIPVSEDGSIWRRDDYWRPPRFEDQHPSAYDPSERAKVMDSYGIQAAVTFPSLGLTGPDIFKSIPAAGLDFQLDLVSAYNDWVLTWPQTEPGRYIPLGVVPYWDVPAAVREIERCAGLGMKGIVMTGKPQNHDCPLLGDPHWDDLWAAAEANKQSVSFHVAGGGITDTVGNDRLSVMGHEALMVYIIGTEFFQNAIAAVDLLLSGVLHKHPTLNFGIVETGVGWVNFALETLDEHYLRYKPWLSRPEMSPDELPSEVFRRQVFVNTWFERSNSTYPYENVMFETDYPHPTCLLGPEIDDAIDNRMASLSPEQLEGVLWKNAMRCFNLKPADIGLVADSGTVGAR
jgi:predicted TIM-barrel fold metal-dependent hydrolase